MKPSAISRGKGFRRVPRARDTVDERRAVRKQAIDAFGTTCVLRNLQADHRCFGRTEGHELRKASQGGRYEEGNVVPLCSAGNTWIEDHPLLAHELGLVRRHGE